MIARQANKLKAALAEAFEAEVEAEKIAPGRYRFSIISPQFDQMPQLKRQDAAWKVVDRMLTTEASIDISLILTYAPHELERAV